VLARDLPLNKEEVDMEGSFLRFYVHEGDRCHGHLAWEWLLMRANKMGVRGGSAFRAMAGFGSHHVLHEYSFFELAGTLAVEVEFVVTEQETEQLLELVRAEGLRMFYARIPARFGVINPDKRDDNAARADAH
jgi:PII-like signaling protein